MLDAVISTSSAQANLDGRGSKVLAGAVTLRDSTGRDRLPVMRQMCTVWDVSRRENIYGQWKDHTLATLQELLTNAVCLAATRWQAE